MKRFPSLFLMASIGLAGFAAFALADEPSAAESLRPRGGRRHGLRRFRACLSSVGLSADRQTAVDSLLSDARATLQADLKALKADRERLRADLSSGADTSVLGQDVLNQNASATKLKSDIQATRDQVLAKLTAEQQSAFNVCPKQRRGKGDGREEEQP